jgi:hypothetical protein
MARRARDQVRVRTRVELDLGGVMLHGPDGRSRAIPLQGCTFTLSDAACNRRFVRLLCLEHADGAAELMTPPEGGAIAPRAAHLPIALEEKIAVIEGSAFDALLDWLVSRGRLGGRSIEELARLARLATTQLAVLIGELAARAAGELAWGGSGPMRGSGLDGRELLRPLELAARDSERASDAWVAALAHWPRRSRLSSYEP